MDIQTRYGQYWDQQAVAQFAILHKLDDTPMKRFAELWLVDHLAALTAGRVQASKHRTVERRIQEVDPHLYLRYDFDQQMYAVDKFVPEWGYYFTLFYWSHTLGDGSALRQILKESDMQRPEYLTEKKLAADLTRERMDKLRTEMALAPIDAMSTSQLQKFYEVERAMQTGEKIFSTGKDADILNRLYEHTRDSDRQAADLQAQLRANGQDIVVVPNPAMAGATPINPMQHPFRHRRTRKG